MDHAIAVWLALVSIVCSNLAALGRFGQVCFGWLDPLMFNLFAEIVPEEGQPSLFHRLDQRTRGMCRGKSRADIAAGATTGDLAFGDLANRKCPFFGETVGCGR